MDRIACRSTSERWHQEKGTNGRKIGKMIMAVHELAGEEQVEDMRSG